MKNDCICIIPARGGSKRIPRKNITDFNGKPLIAWSIQTAIDSGLFSDVVVSTDDPEIADVAISNGASVPFERDPSLADDFATTADVLKDALQRLEPSNTVCCFYPTAPMITADDLSSAYDKLKQQDANCVISVTEYDFHPLRAFAVGRDQTLSFNWPEHALTRSQDLPEMLHDAGAFYLLNVSSFVDAGAIIHGKTLGQPIPRNRALDIDTPTDLEMARAQHRALIQS